MQGKNEIIVDAVITWVDGNDPKHKAKMAQFIDNQETINNKAVRMRYDQVNEIEFAVKSILKYAKFVRNIFIVTDNQTPDFLRNKEKVAIEYPNVFIVDHKIIFDGYHQYLPTFNSLSIETLLFKIPNLAKHFIYFNDDVFLTNKTNLEDFFKNGKPIIRGKWHTFYENIWYKKLNSWFKKNIKINKPEKYKHKKGLQKPAELLGFNNYYFTEHIPSVIRKSTLETFFNNNEVELISNIKHRFRKPSQFIMHSLANHIEIQSNTAILKKDYQLVYFQNYKKPLLWIKYKLKKAENDKNKLFLCLQSLDQCPEKKLSYFKNWLHQKYD